MTKKRVIGWDLFRLLQIYPIVHFHILEATFSAASEPESLFNSSLYSIVTAIDKFFTTGGLNIVAVSFFVIGFKSLSVKRFKYLLPILITGVLSLNFIYAYAETGAFYFEWDIYHYLVFMITVVFFLDRLRKKALYMLPFFFLLSIIPFWLLDSSYLPVDIRQIFTGVCGQDAFGIWALLPWAFWALTFWSTGVVFKDNIKLNVEKLNLVQVLGVVGVSIGLYLFASLTYFYDSPTAPKFACYIHRPEFLPFLAHYVSLILLFCFVSHRKLDELLQKYSFSVTKLYWSKHLGLTYLSHIVLLSLSNIFIDLGVENGTIFIMYIVGHFIAAELSSRFVLQFIKSLQRAKSV